MTDHFLAKVSRPITTHESSSGAPFDDVVQKFEISRHLLDFGRNANVIISIAFGLWPNFAFGQCHPQPPILYREDAHLFVSLISHFLPLASR